MQDRKVVLQDLELLVQDWCRICIPIPEFRPELYIYHSKLQLENQRMKGKGQQQQQQQQQQLTSSTHEYNRSASTGASVSTIKKAVLTTQEYEKR